MSKIQMSAEVVEGLLLRDLYNMQLTERESNALNSILLHLSVTGEYSVPEHLKVIK